MKYNVMRNPLSLLLVMALLAGMLPVRASAEVLVPAEESGFVIVDGVLTDYTGPGGVVVIPESVTTIGLDAFYGCTSLTGVVIPESVVELKARAFSGCTNLVELDIPDSVTTIGAEAFYGCVKLERVKLPEGLVMLWSRLFSLCESLVSITIPQSVTYMSNHVFYGCSKLEDVTLPDGLGGIGADAFYGCVSLETISLPETVSFIGDHAFSGCTKLTEVVLPAPVYSIGIMAFAYCDSLTKLVAPYTLTRIGSGAFEMSPNLTIYGYEGSAILAYAAENAIPFESMGEAPSSQHFLIWDGELIEYHGPGGEVVIPNEVTAIGDGAFYNHPDLTGVIIPNSVTRIGSGAFYGCEYLTDIAIPASVTGIGSRAFYGCENLTVIAIPASVTDIGSGVFDLCPNLTIYGENYSEAHIYAAMNGIPFLTVDGEDASPLFFLYDDCLVQYFGPGGEVAVPDGITGISTGAFAGNEDITGITIPASVTNISFGAFSSCTALTTIQVASDHSTYISVDGILFTADQKTLHTYPAGNTAAAYVVPGDVTHIGERAFSNCEDLAHIYLPEGTTEISAYAFSDCSGLERIYISAPTLHDLDSDAFNDCPAAFCVRTDAVRASLTEYGISDDRIVNAYTITAEITGSGVLAGYPLLALAGDTIPVTAVPASNYELESGSLKYNGIAISGTDFPMPAEDVVLTAKFVNYRVPSPSPSGSAGAPPAAAPTPIWNNPYPDVGEDDWFYPAVHFVTERELMNGTGSDHFSPAVTMTRAMLVAVLYRLHGEPAVSGDALFHDAQSGAWYSDAIQWAQQYNIVDGYADGTFGVDDPVTREQTVTILYRYARAQDVDTDVVADLSGYFDSEDISGWAMPAMQWAVDAGIIHGRTPSTIAPKGVSTRAEVATILQRFVEQFAHETLA